MIRMAEHGNIWVEIFKAVLGMMRRDYSSEHY